MKRILYIGQNSPGTTSRMRATKLRDIFADYEFEIIDTNIPFLSSNRIYQSLAFRFKKGPLIKKINKFIRSQVKEGYEIIWVDKAIYLEKKLTVMLRGLTKKLIHFTPDPAFLFHNSNHFKASLKYYDYLITTKSYELELYSKYVQENKILLATQGFDDDIHYPRTPFNQKVDGVVFIGHYEKERGEVIMALNHAGIKTTVAGKKWGTFLKRQSDISNIHYLGEGVYGEDYSKQISLHKFGIGFLSKWVPELHTTRTFEIPACGTALITEKNEETKAMFSSNEVIFYNDINEIIKQVQHLRNEVEELETITANGNHRVISDGYDYTSILMKILTQISL